MFTDTGQAPSGITPRGSRVGPELTYRTPLAAHQVGARTHLQVGPELTSEATKAINSSGLRRNRVPTGPEAPGAIAGPAPDWDDRCSRPPHRGCRNVTDPGGQIAPELPRWPRNCRQR